MLGYLFEKTTALVSSTVDVVADSVEYIYDDVTAIPGAVSKGWNEGINPEEPVEATLDDSEEITH